VTRAEEFEELRPLLFSIAYRILGSVNAAEEAVQESWLRYAASPAHPPRPRPCSGPWSPGSRVDVLRSARVRREEYVGPWLSESLLTDPYENPERSAELADTVSMAALLLLERLTPLERAVFVPREVFGFGFPDVGVGGGEVGGGGPPARGRVRRHVDAGRPRFEADRREREKLAAQFFGALREGDVGRPSGAARR
jgi:RNA polymerase sigma-70 factor, ECF subfamily